MTDKNSAAKAGAPASNGKGDPLGSNSEIGRQLKKYYDGLVSDDVPDRFADLLKQLEERESEPAGRDGE